jgi:hypothetical protein
MHQRLNQRWLLAIAVVSAAALISWRGLRHPHSPPSSDSARPGNGAPALPHTSSPAHNLAPVHAGQNTVVQALAQWRVSSRREQTLATLQELHQKLSHLSTPDVVNAIGQFLDTRQDAPTGLGFVLEGDGQLAEAPSLRVFLLDWLAQIDPSTAAEDAGKVLAAMDSADEWAVALRNLARVRNTPEARDFLSGRMRALLQHEPWRRAPLTGYLEAFDLAVFLGGTNLMPSLAELARQPESPALAHAAYLALDRLVIADPATALAAVKE